MAFKKSIKFVLPLIAWAIGFGWLQYSRYVTDEAVFGVDSVVWSTGENKLSAAVSRNVQGEIESSTVTIKTADGRVVYTLGCEIDWDMGGSGFVRALNLDDDPELEILCYRNRKDGSNYLNLSSGGVVELPFSQASGKAQQLAKDWRDAHHPNSFALTAWVMITLLYYVLLLVYIFLAFIFKRIRQRHREQKQPESLWP